MRLLSLFNYYYFIILFIFLIKFYFYFIALQYCIGFAYALTARLPVDAAEGWIFVYVHMPARSLPLHTPGPR